MTLFFVKDVACHDKSKDNFFLDDDLGAHNDEGPQNCPP